MKSEFADYASVQAQYGNLSGYELTRNLLGNIRPQSPQLTEWLWTDPGIKSDIIVLELISTLKEAQSGGIWMVEHSPKVLASEEKASSL